jgi:hypothetical protein
MCLTLDVRLVKPGEHDGFAAAFLRAVGEQLQCTAAVGLRTASKAA